MSKPMRVWPEEMRLIAKDLDRLGGETSCIFRELMKGWSRLDSGWHWYAREDINGYFRATLREIHLMSEMLNQMGKAVYTTADLIEAADREAVGFFVEQDDRAGQSTTGQSEQEESLFEKGLNFFKGGIEKGKEVVNDVGEEFSKVITFVRTEGVQALDALVYTELDARLPYDAKNDEEFVGYKAEGQITIPGGLVGLPTSIYVEGGADVRVTRDKAGNFVVTIAGMTGGGVDWSDSMAGVEAQGGLRGRGELQFTFDPDSQGDMSALLALLATTGGLGMLAAGSLNSVAGAGVLTITETGMILGGEQVNFLDNLSGFQLEGGWAAAVEGEVPALDLAGEGEWMYGMGMEMDKESGQVCPTTSFRLSVEGSAELDDSRFGGGIEIEAIGKINPPGSELTISLERAAGQEFELPDGIPGVDDLDIDLVGSHTVEIKLESEMPVEEFIGCYDSQTGQFDFSAWEDNISVEVNVTDTFDGSLEAELGVSSSGQKVEAEVSAGSYIGRKRTVWSSSEE